MLIAMHLENLIADIDGTTTDLAASECEAVDLAMARPPALILSNVRLPQGPGPGAVQAIREKLGAVPVIYVTGNPEHVDGDVPVITKPVRDEVLIATASQMLAGGPIFGQDNSGAS